MTKNLNKKYRGFTLIELLVVIAIIGILVTIVLVSFGPIRDQARDTSIKANLQQMRLAAELHYNEKMSYLGTATRTDFMTAEASALDASPSATTTKNIDADDYCLQFELATDGSWCVDSTGYVGSNANCTVGSDESAFSCTEN